MIVWALYHSFVAESMEKLVDFELFFLFRPEYSTNTNPLVAARHHDGRYDREASGTV